LKRFNNIIPLLDPLNDMKIKDPTLYENITKLEALERRYTAHPLRASSNFNDIYKKYEQKLELEAELKAAKAELKKAQSLLQLEELKCRLRVLRRLQYCDEKDVILPKVGDELCPASASNINLFFLVVNE
uniref:rRNA_proc-arch domain-containing protein n=1 Tax=Gongylonema pulchrum TaxID=637853 RepID=A0A183DGC7_9BILA